MCVVSMVTDHYQKIYPSPLDMSPDTYYDIMELIRKAKEYDRLNKQPDCIAKYKQAWLDALTMSPVKLYSIGQRT